MENNGDIPHLDALGYRYYIAAFMQSLVDSPSSGSIREISTIMSLCPAGGQFKNFHEKKYAALNLSQRMAILAFLTWFRTKPDTDPEDRTNVDLAIAGYWSKCSAETPNQSKDSAP
jgi:hypothetical protein